MVLYYVGLFAVLALPAGSSIQISDAWDYGLLIYLNETENGFEFPGQLVWEARGDITALPGQVIHNGTNTEIEDRTFTTPCCREWVKKGWVTVKDREAAGTFPLLDYSFQWNNQSGFPAEVWALQGEKGTMQSEEILSSNLKYNRNNITVPIKITIVARPSIESSIEMNLENSDGTGRQPIGEIFGNPDNVWVLKRLPLYNAEVKPNSSLRISLVAKQPRDWVSPVLVQWVSISFSSEETSLNIDVVHNYIETRDTFYMPLTKTPSVLVEDPVCLHGSVLDVTGGRCQCTAGFSGTLCEHGCGPNKYGPSCQGQCSKDSENRQCRGVLSCSEKGGCQCMSGLQGRSCNETCHHGMYGTNCMQKCGHCAGNETCDRYTGRCGGGCEEGYQPPFCQTDACGISSSGHTDFNNPEVLFWHSAIYEKKNGVFKAACSGSLIAPRFLLSAAWCFYSERLTSVKSPSRFVVLFGTEERFDFTDLTYPRKVQAQKVASLHVPSLYRGQQRSHADDIAVVELTRDVRPSPAIAPVCIDVEGDVDDDLLDGDVGYVAGWGSLETNCTICLRNGTEIEYVTHSNCLNQVSESLLLAIGPEKFCGQLSSGEIVDSALQQDPSDIGSGFLYLKNGAWFLYGVKSAAGSDAKNGISAYTSVRAYAKWITDTCNQCDVKHAITRNA